MQGSFGEVDGHPYPKAAGAAGEAALLPGPHPPSNPTEFFSSKSSCDLIELVQPRPEPAKDAIVVRRDERVDQDDPAALGRVKGMHGIEALSIGAHHASQLAQHEANMEPVSVDLEDVPENVVGEGTNIIYPKKHLRVYCD